MYRLIITTSFLLLSALSLAEARLEHLSLPQNEDKCPGYTQLDKDIDKNAEGCKDLLSAIPAGEDGCELRERLRATFAYVSCTFSVDKKGWIEQESNEVDWSNVFKIISTIQVGEELKGVTEICLQAESEVTQEQLEAITKELFGIVDDDEGEGEGEEKEEEEDDDEDDEDDDEEEENEQDPCWNDALQEVKSYVATLCLINNIQAAYEEVCV